jgi:hypothetical protein
MAYQYKVLRLTAFGTAFGGDEQWSTGFYVGDTTGDVLNPIQASADQFLGLWTTFFNTTSVSISNAYKTEGVRVTLMKTDGKMDPAFNFYAYPTVPFSGPNVGSPLPAQTSLVATLQATPDRGLASKGRMFLPGINHTLQTDGKLSSTNVSSIATALRTMLNGVNASFDIGGSVINASKGGTGLNVAPPINRHVTNLLIGNVYDTQRRRRNTLHETYTNLTVTV